ncbi:MAG: pentapeptide repeat-containing protein, partial [Actinobacteria bacterium]|nr:pentapeptide repeat-containing protein [Actinomycetota bacterium]
DGCNLQSAQLYGACLDGVSLRHADLDAARLGGASLREADLTAALIVKAQFHEADATGATFDDLVYAGRAEFYGACLRGARFRRAHLSEVSFIDADLTGADFTNAVLLRTSFHDAHVHGASFEGASGSILDSGAYVEEGDDAPLVSAAELARWMEARGATGVSVFISPLAHLLRPPPSSDADPPA